MEGLWRYYRDDTVLNNPGLIAGFIGNDTSDSFNFKEKITGQTGDDGTKDAKRMVPLKNLGNFRKTLKISPINSKLNPIPAFSANCNII